MKKFLLFSISLLFGLSLAVWIYTHIDLRDVFLRFGFLAWGQIIVLFALTLFKIIIWIFRWKFILKAMGFEKIPFRSLAGARLGEMTLSYLTPGIFYGGEIMRVFALKKSTNIPVSQGLISVISDRIIEIFAFGILAFLGACILFFQKNLLGGFIFTILGCLPLILIGLIFKLLKSNKVIGLTKFFHLHKKNFFKQNGGENGLVEKIKFISKGIIAFFQKSQRTIFYSIILSCFGFVMRAIQIVIFVHFLNEFIPFKNALLIRILTLFSGLIPIPAMLGIYEGTSILAFQSVQLTAETGLSFTLITRLIDFSFVFVGLLIIAYYLTHHVFKFFNGKNNNTN